MSLSAFLQQYVKPTRWWRRRRTIQFTVWPRWIAQALCPHIPKQMIMFDVVLRTKTSLCLDCHKHLEEINDCVHAEVSVCMVETVGAQLVPRSFRCDHCGVELEMHQLPTDVKVSNLNLRNE